MKKLIFILLLFTSSFVFSKEFEPTIIQAAIDNDLETVKSEIKNGININTRDEMGRTALMEASYVGNLEIVKYLLDDSDKEKADVNLVDKNGNSALILACSGCHLDVVKVLIENAADIEVKEKIDGYTPLMIVASLCKNRDLAEYLIENGANIYRTSNNGENAIDKAYKKQNFGVYSFLKMQTTEPLR